MSDRAEKVCVGNVLSDSIELDLGVLQGSDPGPTLYNLYKKRSPTSLGNLTYHIIHWVNIV